MTKLLVETHRLTKRYGSFAALIDCSLQIGRGEIHGLLGPNGAGKTTLIRLLMGFLRPSDGWARIGGLDCYRQSVAVHRTVAYLPGEARLFGQLRGREVLRFFADMRGDDVATAYQLAERLKLDTSRLVGFMSTGMRQKLALAATFSASARLLILDEPTANLDPNVRHEVLRMVIEAKERGRTVLFSSHVLSEIEDTCDHVSIVREGKLVHQQVMSELRHQHRIRARLFDRMPEIPDAVRREITLCRVEDERLTVETPGELSPILGWLACLPIDEVTIHPIGLRAVYDRFHHPEASAWEGASTEPEGVARPSSLSESAEVQSTR